MKPWVSLAQTRTPDGSLLQLCQRGHEFVIRAGGHVLMGSHRPGSERAMAQLALDAMTTRDRPAVLIGGLGCGFTLRAALDRLIPQATVTVSELVPAVVDWNRGALGKCAAEPLTDSRVEVAIGDIKQLLLQTSDRFDVVMLDVDNGPQAFTQTSNGWLYSGRGLRAIRRALREKGVLAVWSAGPDDAFAERLGAAGFDTAEHTVRSANSRRGERHVVWVAVKSGATNGDSRRL